MRKIEQKMIANIRSFKAGAVGGNTFVDFLPVAGSMGNDPDKTCCIVVLYNTEIARLFIDKTTGRVLDYSYDHGGYRTPTTKSRINAIAQAFGLRGVYQKNFSWFLSDDIPF